jgi:hypothetical protein
MAISAPHGYVTQGPWGVSVTSGSGIKGAVLHVYRDGIHGDAEGRQFPSTDEAFAFAASRGYQAPYFRRHAVWKARNREFCRQVAWHIRVGVRVAETAQEIHDLAEAAKTEVLAHGCDLLDSMVFFNAVYWVARKLRPGLLPGLSLAMAKEA